MKIIDPYENYQSAPLPNADGVYGDQHLNRVSSLQVGFGSKVMRIDRDGMWLGAEDFASAPFSVDMEGNITGATVDLTGYLQVGEALTDIGAGNVTATYLASNSVTGTKIEDGAITTGKIATNAVTAGKIDVDYLSAITADLGTITAGSITGITITGGTVRTASSGARIQLVGSSTALQCYDATRKRMELDEDSISFIDSAGSSCGYLAGVGGSLFIIGGSGGVDMPADLDMNNYSISNVYRLELDYSTSNTVGSGQIRHYVNGGTYYLVARVGSSTTFRGSINLTAV